MDSGDAARSIPSLRIDRGTFIQDAIRHSHRSLIRTFTGKFGLHGMGLGRAIQWKIYFRTRHTSEGAYRTQVWDDLARVCDREITRADFGHPRLLGYLAKRHKVKFPRRVLQSNIDVAVFSTPTSTLLSYRRGVGGSLRKWGEVRERCIDPYLHRRGKQRTCKTSR